MDKKLDTILYNRVMEISEKVLKQTEKDAKKAVLLIDDLKEEIFDKLKTIKSETWSQKEKTEFSNFIEGKINSLGSNVFAIAFGISLAVSKFEPDLNKVLSFDNNITNFNLIKKPETYYNQLISNLMLGGKQVKYWLDGIYDKAVSPRLVSMMESPKTISYNMNTVLSGIVKNDVTSLMFTYANGVNNMMIEEIIEANPHVYNKVRWVAQLEIGSKKRGGTCIKCAGLSGMIFPKNDHPECPLHPHCRCVLVPVPDNIDEYSVSSEYKNIMYERYNEPIEESYDSFFKTQSDAVQKQVLGKGRYSLYKERNLHFSDFIDVKTGRLKLLSEF